MVRTHPIDSILERLRGVKEHSGYFKALCPCPSHGDEDPSLQVSERADHSVGVFCHGGCSFADVMAALDLPQSAAFADRPNPHFQQSRITARSWVSDQCAQPAIQDIERRPAQPLGPDDVSYIYDEEAGNVVGRVVRAPEKNFFQQASDGNGGFWQKLHGVQLPIYGLSRIANADPAELVWVVKARKTLTRW